MFKVSSDQATVLVEWASGYAQHKRLASGLVFLRISGHASAELAAHHWRFLDPELAQSTKLALLVDGSEFENYATGYRIEWTNWLRNSRAVAHLYTESRLVRMGATVVGLATNAVRAYDSLPALYEFGKTVMPGFSPRSLPPSLKKPARAPSASTAQR